MPTPILEHIGLTKREAEVYEHLLRLGESPIADILKATGAHPQVVYRAIDSLLAKGLATASIRKHRQYVRAEDPRKLEQMEEKKMEELRKAVPDLLALQKTSRDAIIRVARGNEAVRTIRAQGVDRLTSKDIHYIIGASGDRFYEVMGDRYEGIEHKRIKKKIRKKLVTFESQRKMIEDQERFIALREIRYLPENFRIPSSTNIFRDLVAILIWSRDPIVITIESPEVAESYRHYFDALWKIAKP